MRLDLNLIIAFTFIVNACSKPVAEEESPVKPKVSVEVAELRTGIVKDQLTLSASTLFLKRNVVTSPIPAFISKVFIKLGDAVKKGQILYVLETKERRALGADAVLPGSTSDSYGRIDVKAPAAGIISTLDKQQIGDYVLEGSPLCTIAERETLAFAVNVPFEFSVYAKAGAKCMLLLPDNSLHPARFTKALATMNALAQTQTILAKSDDRLSLPENLIVKVLVNKNSDIKRQILPKMAVLSDEMMENFWVMKLINDSMAIKTNVTPGTMNKDSVEIKAPLFKVDDKFLVSGNYGLPDTAFVRVIH